MSRATCGDSWRCILRVPLGKVLDFALILGQIFLALFRSVSPFLVRYAGVPSDL